MVGERIKTNVQDRINSIKASINMARDTSVVSAVIFQAKQFGINNRRLVRQTIR